MRTENLSVVTPRNLPPVKPTKSKAKRKREPYVPSEPLLRLLAAVLRYLAGRKNCYIGGKNNVLTPVSGESATTIWAAAKEMKRRSWIKKTPNKFYGAPRKNAPGKPLDERTGTQDMVFEFDSEFPFGPNHFTSQARRLIEEFLRWSPPLTAKERGLFFTAVRKARIRKDHREYDSGLDWLASESGFTEDVISYRLLPKLAGEIKVSGSNYSKRKSATEEEPPHRIRVTERGKVCSFVWAAAGIVEGDNHFPRPQTEVNREKIYRYIEEHNAEEMGAPTIAAVVGCTEPVARITLRWLVQNRYIVCDPASVGKRKEQTLPIKQATPPQLRNRYWVRRPFVQTVSNSEPTGATGRAPQSATSPPRKRNPNYNWNDVHTSYVRNASRTMNPGQMATYLKRKGVPLPDPPPLKWRTLEEVPAGFDWPGLFRHKITRNWFDQVRFYYKHN